MNRPDLESANHAVQDPRFPLISDNQAEERSAGVDRFAPAGYQNQEGVSPSAGSRLDELMSEDDIEWGE